MYHSINSNHPASVRPKDFEKQIKWLKDNYSIVNLWDPLNFQEDSVAITFDDGYEDNFIYAFPILKKYNCPATIFVTTGLDRKSVV